MRWRVRLEKTCVQNYFNAGDDVTNFLTNFSVINVTLIKHDLNQMLLADK